MTGLSRRLLLAGAATLSLGIASSTASAEETIKIGVLATLEGAFTVLGEDSMRGADLAFEQAGMMAADKKLEIIKASSDASPNSALRAARKLVEDDKVQILLGPLSGSEGLALRDYAKTQPQVTFVNGTSAAQDTTLRDPAPNFYRFSTDGVQWQAGLGTYAYEDKGYKSAVVIAEDYSFPYSQVQGFMLEFCKLGGKVPEKFWVPIGNKDYSTIVASIPDDVDAIYVALGGADAVNFLTQYQQAGGDKPMIGGSITVDPSVMGSQARLGTEYLAGTPSAGPIADAWEDERWQAFVKAYQSNYPDGFPSPSLFAHGYYVGALAILAALDEVNGDLGEGQQAFRAALDSLELETPTGKVTLDENRQAIADIFLTELAVNDQGQLYNKVVKVIPQVNQTLGQPREEFLKLGPVSRTNPECP
ncbi:MAG: ABC transporter substrate-binding protein [Rhodospirillales bacterium]